MTKLKKKACASLLTTLMQRHLFAHLFMQLPFQWIWLKNVHYTLADWIWLLEFASYKSENTWHFLFYYLNTTEIPSELSRENFISSHVKITCYLHTWRDLCHYGCIINRAFESKLIWYFTGVYIINRILHTCLWIRILSSHVQLDISLVRCAHSWDIELTTQR